MSDLPPCVECGTPTGNNYGGWIACDLCFHEIIVQPGLEAKLTEADNQRVLQSITDGADIG